MRPASGRPSLAAMSCTRAWASWHVARTMRDRKSTRLNSSHLGISYAVFCLKKKKKQKNHRGGVGTLVDDGAGRQREDTLQKGPHKGALVVTDDIARVRDEQVNRRTHVVTR